MTVHDHVWSSIMSIPAANACLCKYLHSEEGETKMRVIVHTQTIW